MELAAVSQPHESAADAINGNDDPIFTPPTVPEISRAAARHVEQALTTGGLNADNHGLLLSAAGFLKFLYDRWYENDSEANWYVVPKDLDSSWGSYFENADGRFRILHTIYANSGVELLDSRYDAVCLDLLACWWKRCTWCIAATLPGKLAPTDQKQWIGYVVEHTREDGSLDLLVTWRGILFKAEWCSSFCGDHMVPYHATTRCGESCGWLRGMPRVHAGWKYIYTRTLPVRSEHELTDFPPIQRQGVAPTGNAATVKTATDNGVQPRTSGQGSRFLDRIMTMPPSHRLLPSPASPQQGIRNALYRLIRSRGKRINRVLVSGHSLGGALAVLCAYDCAYYLQEELALAGEQLPQVGLVSFGQPRVGDLRFDAEVRRRGVQLVRVVNVRDAVPWIPGACETCSSCWLCCSPCACLDSPACYACDRADTPPALQAGKALCSWAWCWCPVDGWYYHQGQEVVVDSLRDGAIKQFSSQAYGHRLDVYTWMLLTQVMKAVSDEEVAQVQQMLKEQGPDSNALWQEIRKVVQRWKGDVGLRAASIRPERSAAFLGQCKGARESETPPISDAIAEDGTTQRGGEHSSSSMASTGCDQGVVSSSRGGTGEDTTNGQAATAASLGPSEAADKGNALALQAAEGEVSAASLECRDGEAMEASSGQRPDGGDGSEESPTKVAATGIAAAASVDFPREGRGIRDGGGEERDASRQQRPDEH